MNGGGVRAAQAGDLPALAELFDLYRQFYEQPADRARAQAFMAQRLERGDAQVLVAEAAGGTGLDGFCQLYPTWCSVEAQPIHVLYDLFVRPQARGTGVGRRLLLAAEACSRTAGMARMDLSTARSNHAAQALYESLGWERDDVFLTYHRVPGAAR